MSKSISIIHDSHKQFDGCTHIYSMRYWYKGTKENIPEKMKKKRTTENKKQKHHKPK